MSKLERVCWWAVVIMTVAGAGTGFWKEVVVGKPVPNAAEQKQLVPMAPVFRVR